MSLISILIALIIFGAILYLVDLAPIDGTVKRVIQVVAIVFLIIWALQKLAPSLGSLGF